MTDGVQQGGREGSVCVYIYIYIYVCQSEGGSEWRSLSRRLSSFYCFVRLFVVFSHASLATVQQDFTCLHMHP